MNRETKLKIVAKLESKASLLGSRNKLAQNLNFIGAPQLTNVFNPDKWENVSEDMWRKLADAVELNKEEWVIVETSSYKFTRDLLEDSKEYGNTYFLIGGTGFGKTVTTKAFASTQPNTFRVECSEFWNKKTFMIELLQSMGRNSDGLTTYDIIRLVESEIIKMEMPIIILDEADKLKDEVLYFFITLYNKLYGRCGLFCDSTDYMVKRITKGLRSGKKGYQELFSRIGRKFIYCPEPNSNDIAAICKANGVTDQSTIERAINESESDLRRVERIVHSTKRREKKNKK